MRRGPTSARATSAACSSTPSTIPPTSRPSSARTHGSAEVSQFGRSAKYSANASDCRPVAMLLADGTGETRADLVSSDGTVQLTTGTGFGAPVSWGVGMPPYALFPSAGDINGDGLAD